MHEHVSKDFFKRLKPRLWQSTDGRGPNPSNPVTVAPVRRRPVRLGAVNCSVFLCRHERTKLGRKKCGSLPLPVPAVTKKTHQKSPRRRRCHCRQRDRFRSGPFPTVRRGIRIRPRACASIGSLFFSPLALPFVVPVSFVVRAVRRTAGVGRFWLVVFAVCEFPLACRRCRCRHRLRLRLRHRRRRREETSFTTWRRTTSILCASAWGLASRARYVEAFDSTLNQAHIGLSVVVALFKRQPTSVWFSCRRCLFICRKRGLFSDDRLLKALPLVFALVLSVFGRVLLIPVRRAELRTFSRFTLPVRWRTSLLHSWSRAVCALACCHVSQKAIWGVTSIAVRNVSSARQRRCV